MEEEIKRTLKSGNACYYLAQNYNFAYFLYGCATWSLTLREECRLRVFEKRVLRRIFGAKRDEVTGSGEN